MSPHQECTEARFWGLALSVAFGPVDVFPPPCTLRAGAEGSLCPGHDAVKNAERRPSAGGHSGLGHPPPLLLRPLLSPLFLCRLPISPLPSPCPSPCLVLFHLSVSPSVSLSTSVTGLGVWPSVLTSISTPVFSPGCFRPFLSLSPVSPSLSPVSVSFLTPAFLPCSLGPPFMSHNHNLPGEAEDPNQEALALSHFRPGSLGHLVHLVRSFGASEEPCAICGHSLSLGVMRSPGYLRNEHLQISGEEPRPAGPRLPFQVPPTSLASPPGPPRL